MAEQLELLKHLQEIDTVLLELRRQEEEKPEELEQATAEVSAQEAKLQESDTRLKTLKVQQGEREIELQSKEGQVKKFQGQLIQVKTNREYSALQHELAALHAETSLLEETILKGYEIIEGASAARDLERGRVEAAQQRLKTDRARIEQDVQRIQDQIARVEQGRQQITSQLSSEILVNYERILESRDGLALAPLMQESCGGCNRRLPPQVVNEVYLEARLVTCEHCNRILYRDKSASPTP